MHGIIQATSYYHGALFVIIECVNAFGPHNDNHRDMSED